MTPIANRRTSSYMRPHSDCVLTVNFFTCFVGAMVTEEACWRCCCLMLQQVLKPLVEIALQISHLRELTGRTQPDVIT